MTPLTPVTPLPPVTPLAPRALPPLTLEREGHGGQRRTAAGQGLTLVHSSAQPKPFWSHLSVSPGLIDWGQIMHSTYPTKCAYVEPRSGRV